MVKEEIQAIFNMIMGESPDMQELAVNMFCANSTTYEDYWNLRSLYNGFHIPIPSVRVCFDRIYQNVDPMTIEDFYNEKRREYIKAKGNKIGREKVIKKTCIFASKQEQIK